MDDADVTLSNVELLKIDQSPFSEDVIVDTLEVVPGEDEALSRVLDAARNPSQTLVTAVHTLFSASPFAYAHTGAPKNQRYVHQK